MFPGRVGDRGRQRPDCHERAVLRRKPRDGERSRKRSRDAVDRAADRQNRSVLIRILLLRGHGCRQTRCRDERRQNRPDHQTSSHLTSLWFGKRERRCIDPYRARPQQHPPTALRLGHRDRRDWSLRARPRTRPDRSRRNGSVANPFTGMYTLATRLNRNERILLHTITSALAAGRRRPICRTRHDSDGVRRRIAA